MKLIYFAPPLLQEFHKIWQEAGAEAANLYAENLPLDQKLELIINIQEMVNDAIEQSITAKIRRGIEQTFTYQGFTKN